MGTLTVKAYPTRMAAYLADHTYVECANGGRGWACFGGKTGGHVIRSGTGSTVRADAIATPNEQAGLACYLINGVCHQAANRILLAAGITVEGARGYGVSHAMFGVYGRVGVWPCSSPFNKHETVTGDLPACEDRGLDAVPDWRPKTADDQAEVDYLRSTLAIYEAHAALLETEGRPIADGEETRLGEVQAFHLQLFEHMLDFKLGPDLDQGDLRRRLLEIRRGIEDRQLDIDRQHANDELTGPGLADAVDGLARELQGAVAQETTDAQYGRLFGLSKDEVLGVADPDIVAAGEDRPTA